MDNGLLTLVILGSVLVGALLPLLAMLAMAVYRASREISAVGAQLKRTLAHVELISDRVEVLSRGLKGGETSLAELMTSVGTLAHGLDRNMKAVSVFSTIAASVGSAIAAYVASRLPAGEAGPAPAHDGAERHPDAPAAPPPAESPPPAFDAH